MKIDVYDTYAQNKNGEQIHFDVLIQSQDTAENAYKHALEFIKDMQETFVSLTQSNCRFCHTENASPRTILEIQNKGYAIIQMEGCPDFEA